MRNALRRWAVALAVVALIAAAALVGVRTYFYGPFLARLVRAQLEPGIAGRIETTSIEWDLAGALRGGGRLPLTLRDVQVIDVAHDEKVLELPVVEATVDVWALVAGGHGDVLVDRLSLRGGTAMIRMHPGAGDAGPGPESNLAAVFRSRRPAQGAAGAQGAIIHVRAIALEDVDVTLDFPAWRAEIRGIDSHAAPPDGAWIRRSARDPAHPELDLALPLRADSARLRIGAEGSPYEVELRDLDVTELTIPREARDRLAYDVVCSGMEGTGVHARGALLLGGEEESGVELELALDNAGALAARHSAGHVTGDDLDARLVVEGTWRAGPLATLEASGAEVTDEPGGRVDRLRARLDLGTGLVTIDELLASTLDGQAFAGGTIHLPAAADVASPRFDLALEVRRPLDVSAWVPPDVARHTGSTRLTGGLRVAGTVEDLRAHEIGLTLGTARVTGAVRVLDRGATAHPDRLTVAFLGARATASGDIDVARRKLDVQVTVAARRLAPLLRHLDVPALARGVSGQGHVGGSLDDPTASGSLSFDGVVIADRVDARLEWRRGVLDLRRLHGRPLEGELNGSGRLVFGPGGKPVLRVFNLSAEGLALGRIPGTGGLLSGRADFRLDAEGALAPLPDGKLTFAADDLSVASWRVGQASSEVSFGGETATIRSLHVGGAQGGLDVVGQVGLDSGLALDVALHDLPLAMLPWLKPPGGPGVDGRASLRATVAGTLARPAVAGALDLRGVSLRDTILGAAPIRLEPLPGGRVRFRGKLFQGKYDLDGWLSLGAPFALEARVGFRRVEIEELVALGTMVKGAHGWLSGEATVSVGEAGLKARLHASELALYLDSTDEDGRPEPIEVRSAGEIDVTWDGETARLDHPVALTGPTSSYRLSGSASAGALDLSLEGRVDLALLHAYTRRFLDEARGVAVLDLRLQGTPAKPEATGFVDLRGALVRPRGQEIKVGVPAGRLVLAPDRVELQDLVVEADDQRMHVNGHVTFDDLAPGTVNLRLRGRLPARLLELLPGHHLSSAGGSAAITMKVAGAAGNPDITGVLTFDGPFAIVPRGLSQHEVVLRAGQLRFTNQAIALRKIEGRVDDAPLALSGDPGRCDAEGFCPALRLLEWTPVEGYLGLRVRGVRHRVQGVFVAELVADVALSGDMDSLQLRGAIDLIDGQYIQEFDWQDAFIPRRTAERSVPFWRGSPLLENLNLAVRVRTAGDLRVRNELATLALTGDVELTGTPSRPRFDGQIQAAPGGEIEIPFLPLVFDVSSGVVIFSWTESFPDESPHIDLSARAGYRDNDERDHEIRGRLVGSLAKVELELETDTGLHGSQVAMLVMTGHADVNDVARGSPADASGDGVNRVTGIGNAATTGDLANAVVMKLTSEQLLQLGLDPLRDALPAWIRPDCIRVAPGTVSLHINLCKNLSRTLWLDWEMRKAYDGTSRRTFTFTWQLLETFSIKGVLVSDTESEHEDRERVDGGGRIGATWKFVLR